MAVLPPVVLLVPLAVPVRPVLLVQEEAVLVVLDVLVVLVAVLAAPVAQVLLVAVRLPVAVVVAVAPLVPSVAPEASPPVHASPSAPSGWSTRSSRLLPSVA